MKITHSYNIHYTKDGRIYSAWTTEDMINEFAVIDKQDVYTLNAEDGYTLIKDGEDVGCAVFVDSPDIDFKEYQEVEIRDEEDDEEVID